MPPHPSAQSNCNDGKRIATISKCDPYVETGKHCIQSMAAEFENKIKSSGRQILLQGNTMAGASALVKECDPNAGTAARWNKPRTPWTVPEILLLCIGCLYLLAYAWIGSRGEPLRMDEVLGWIVGSDPSFKHMIYSWELGADGGGISFYLLERLWFHILGNSDVSFRIFSASGFVAGFAVTWVAARRVYSAGIVAVAMCLTWFFSSVLNQQLDIARFYGLFVASGALAVFAYIKAVQERECSTSLKILMFGANFLLVSVHVLGIIYSAALALALLVSDRFQRRARPTLYLSIFAAWLVLLPSLKAIVNTAKVGSPHFWIEKPYLHSLLAVYYVWNWPLLLAGLGAVCVWVEKFSISSAKTRAPETFAARDRGVRIAVWCFLVTWCAIPFAFFCYSRAANPIFTERYFLPVIIAITFAFAGMLRAAFPSWNEKRSLSKPVVWALLLLLGVALPAADHTEWLKKKDSSRIDYRRQIVSVAPPDLPVVFENAHDFTEIVSRQNPSTPTVYRYLLDWSNALNPTSPLMDVPDYHLMEDWKTAGYFAPDIENADQFLGNTRRFVVVHDSAYKWLEHRIIGNPAYDWRQIATIRRGEQHETVWLIARH